MAETPEAIPHPSEVKVGEPTFQQFTGKVFVKLANGEMICINPDPEPVTLVSLGASPLIHQHTPGDIVGLGVSSISGLVAALAAKQDIGDFATAAQFADLASQLADIRTALNGKQPAGHYAGELHTQTITTIIGLQTALDALANRIAVLEPN